MLQDIYTIAFSDIDFIPIMFKADIREFPLKKRSPASFNAHLTQAPPGCHPKLLGLFKRERYSSQFPDVSYREIKKIPHYGILFSIMELFSKQGHYRRDAFFVNLDF